MLAKLSKALQRTGRSSESTDVAFVTVDPARDTPGVLRTYLARFGPEFVGLTGTPLQIEAVERSYHVWSQRLASKPGARDYSEAHGTTMFFIDGRHDIVSLHDESDSVDELARSMRRL